MAELTSTQLSEWEAYDRLDPIGSWRSDLNFAKLSAILLNITNALYHDPKQGAPKELTALDFMPVWDSEELEKPITSTRKQTAEEMREFLLSIADAQNAKVAKEKLRVRTIPPKGWKPKEKQDG